MWTHNDAEIFENNMLLVVLFFLSLVLIFAGLRETLMNQWKHQPLHVEERNEIPAFDFDHEYFGLYLSLTRHAEKLIQKEL